MIRRITARIACLTSQRLNNAATYPAAIRGSTEPNSNQDVSTLNEYTVTDVFVYDDTRNKDFDVENLSVILSL
jgi:hypothetical protein